MLVVKWYNSFLKKTLQIIVTSGNTFFGCQINVKQKKTACSVFPPLNSSFISKITIK